MPPKYKVHNSENYVYKFLVSSISDVAVNFN